MAVKQEGTKIQTRTAHIPGAQKMFRENRSEDQIDEFPETRYGDYEALKGRFRNRVRVKVRS